MSRKIFQLGILFLFLFPIACEKERPDVPKTSTKIIITTDAPANISYRSAEITGDLGETFGQTVQDYGHCWDTLQEPNISKHKTSMNTFNGSEKKDFSSTLQDLIPGKEYYVRAYFIGNNEVVYSSVESFATLPLSKPVIETHNISEVTVNSAFSGGNITANGGFSVTSRGVCWSTSPNPDISNNRTTSGSGTGSFTEKLTGLSENTTYYARAYATNEIGTAYGEEKSFTTKDGIIQISTKEVTNITANSATSGGNISDDGGSPVTARGVCWSTFPNPTESDNKTTDESGTGNYSSQITGLNENTTYHIRAYATNFYGTQYGENFEFVAKDPVSGTFTDSRDGNTYNWIRIGNQVWMAENLTWLPAVSTPTAESNTEPYYYVYGYSGTSVSAAKATSNYATYGVLYNWPAALNACPQGWHLPTDAEWTTLENYLIANGYNYDGTTTGNKIAKAMATTNGWTSSSNTGAVGNTDYPEKRNASGFSALPGGYREDNGHFVNAGGNDIWWSATESGSSSAWYRYLVYSNSVLFRSDVYREDGFSVRCLRDN